MQGLQRDQEIANRGIQNQLSPRGRLRFDELVKRGLVTLPFSEVEDFDKPALEASENPANQVVDDPIVEQPQEIPAPEVAQEIAEAPAPKPELKPEETSFMDGLFGVLDAGATIVSGAVAEGAAGISGLGALAVGKTSEEAEAVINKVRESLTNTPDTKVGKEIMGSAGELLEPVGRFMKDAENSVAEQVYQKTGSPALAAIASTGPALLAEVVGLGAGAGILKVAKVAKKSGLERQITKAIGEATPSKEQLFKASDAIFREIDSQGITIKPEAYSKMVGDIVKSSKKLSLDEKLTPDSVQIVKRLSDMENSPMTLQEFEILREVAHSGKDALKPRDRMISGKIVDMMDDFLDTSGADILRTSKGKFPKDLSEKFGVARNLWGRARRSEMLELAFENADLAAAGFEEGLIAEFRSILKSQKKKKFFNADEKSAMQEVVNGNKKINLARTFGKAGFNPSNLKAGFLNTAVGAGAGGAFLGPVGAVAIPVIGTVSKGLAKRMITNNAKMADTVIRAGKDARAITKAYIESTPKKLRNPDHLAELLMRGDIDLARVPKSKFTDAAKKKTRERREAIGAARTKEKDPRLKLTLKGTQ